MFDDVSQALLTFLVAYSISTLELVTSKYPKTFRLFFFKSWSLHIYSCIYGVLAFTLALILKELIASKVVQISGLGLSNPWVLAVFVGIFSKAFLKTRIYTLTINSTTLPIGLDTIVHVFEPFLLHHIDLDNFNAVKEFIQEYNHFTLKAVKDRVKKNIPNNLSNDAANQAFLLDVNASIDPLYIMELYLYQYGIKTFKRVFR